MKHVYHVHTPVSRQQNLPAFVKMIAAQGVIWHPIFEAGKEPAPASVLPTADWIQPMVCDPCPPDTFSGHW